LRGTQTRGLLRIHYMINPSEDDFTQDEPLAASAQSREGQALAHGEGTLRRTARKASVAAGDTWEQTKEKAGNARERTEVFLRENPIPTIIGALAIGLAIGWTLRYATRSEEREVEVKSPLGNINWSFLSLPFLWPFFKSMKEKYEESAETVKGGVDRLKKIDIERYAKPVRKRWKAWTH
jgi:ElaB/YqjD/DUF883 family membrane-anchored ribosome-binding protein